MSGIKKGRVGKGKRKKRRGIVFIFFVREKVNPGEEGEGKKVFPPREVP